MKMEIFITGPPRSNPQQDEYPFDLLFTDVSAAIRGLQEWNIPFNEYKDWCLVKETTEYVLNPTIPLYSEEEN